MNPQPPIRPLVLIVEDDPVSGVFLRDAAERFPADVTLADSLADARARLAHTRYDLLLVDANLPDGAGRDLLKTLRARGNRTPALAHTAAADAQIEADLRADGFLEVLCKPLSMADLHAALAHHLTASSPPGAADHANDWDDTAALAAVGGEAAHVDALRQLFLAELPTQCSRITAAHANGEVETMRAELHRLTASCGFVGAARLSSAVRTLQAAPADTDALAAFQHAADALLRER